MPGDRTGARPSRELKLAVQCCAYSFRHGSSESTLKVQTEPDLNWGRFVQLASFHRIEAFIWAALSSSSVPKGAEVALAKAASAIAARNLRAANECRTLFRSFQAANVALLFLKGLPLGALAYNNPMLKSAIDIDLLVDPVDLDLSAGLLRQTGYELIAPHPSVDNRNLQVWHRSWKESVWIKGDLQIDLHTRPADNPRLIPTVNVHSPRQSVYVSPGVELPTLARDELFAYLAVHGASSAWFRLKWISDFAGLLHGKCAEELVQLYRRSQELGAGRAAGQALLVSHELFGTLGQCSDLAHKLASDNSILSLSRRALQLVSGELLEPTARRFGTLPIHRTQFQLMPGVSYKLAELSRQAARMLTRVNQGLR